MTWILTQSGRHFDFAAPGPEQIEITDIAHALSHECRYAGHVHRFYSVAQHSVLASRIVPPEHALEALLHDGAEAYCKDIPSPLKALLPDYGRIEWTVDAAIRGKFDLPMCISRPVKHADLILLATERRDLMPEDDTDWPILAGIQPLPETITPLDSRAAYKAFMARWIELMGIVEVAAQ